MRITDRDWHLRVLKVLGYIAVIYTLPILLFLYPISVLLLIGIGIGKYINWIAEEEGVEHLLGVLGAAVGLSICIVSQINDIDTLDPFLKFVNESSVWLFNLYQYLPITSFFY